MMSNIFDKLRFYLTIVILITKGGIISSQVEIRDTIVTWLHHHYVLNDDYSMKEFSQKDDDIDTVYFNSKVIENEYFKLTLVPEFGGRIVSYIYKPNGKEYIYTEEVSTPYLINTNIFYYDWLLLWGGIFPTFPEPEHGKTWCRPWELNVEKENGDTVIVQMTYTDNDQYTGHPKDYNNGITEITCQVDVAVYSGINMFDFDVKLINNKDQQVKYEYWTNTAFSPGSDPEDLVLSANTEMLVPIDKVDIAWNMIPEWSQGEQMDFVKTNDYHEWSEQGILYAAHPLEKDYWGIVNQDTKEGMFRLANNSDYTYGLKFWTWGVDARNADPYNWSEQGRSSIIELWAGVSKQFWKDAYLSAKEVKEWKEQYMPTIGLSSILEFNENGALTAEIINNTNESSTLKVNLMLSKPDRSFSVDVNLKGDTEYNLNGSGGLDADPLGNEVNFDIIHSEYGNGEYQAEIIIKDAQENLLFSAQLPVTLPLPGSISTIAGNGHGVKVYQLGDNMLRVESVIEGSKTIEIYTLTGSMLYKVNSYSTIEEIKLDNPGIYIVRVGTGSGFNISKVRVE